jgi:hypothetical protein
MTVFLVLSGVIALMTAAGHAFSGERFIVPNLDPDTLPRTPFGDGRDTRTILSLSAGISARSRSRFPASC